eukprot:11933918-Prorocentrum_lima.AAC.1
MEPGPRAPIGGGANASGTKAAFCGSLRETLGSLPSEIVVPLHRAWKLAEEPLVLAKTPGDPSA